MALEYKISDLDITKTNNPITLKLVQKKSFIRNGLRLFKSILTDGLQLIVVQEWNDSIMGNVIMIQ